MKFKGKAFKNSILVMFISEMLMIPAVSGVQGFRVQGLRIRAIT